MPDEKVVVRDPAGTNLAQYEEWTEEAAESDQEELDKSGGEFFKVKEGRNLVRFLPGRPGQKPFLTVWQHFIEVPGEQRPVVFNCPRMNPSKQPCPACGESDKLRASSSKVDRDRAFKLNAKIRVFANMIDRKNADRGVQVLGFGKTVHEQLISIRRDPSDGGDFTHPLNGFDIIIEREGTGKNDTEYFCKAARNSTPLHPDPEQVNEWLQHARDLESYAKIPTADEIKKMLLGEGDDTRDEREVNDRPRGNSSRRQRTAQDDVNGMGGGDEDK